MLSVPQIYDKNMHRLAYLDNAMHVSYDLSLNALWTASFALPTDDKKNIYCQAFNFVEIYDGKERIDLFRIIGEDLTRSNDSYCVYNCEHVLATLLNDVLFTYHQIGGIGVRTSEVINYVLSHQLETRWVLSQCDYSRQFEYNFENSNLLAALFSIPKCFADEYIWEWDTTVYPWLLSLKMPDEELKTEIRYKKNMIGIKRKKDDTKIINRLYALGYGEGVNQLTISAVNNGVPYVEDIVSQQEYGIISSILVDSRYEVAESLKGYAEQILEQSSQPYVSYEVQAIDLFRMNNDDFGRFLPGRTVRVIDEVDNISVMSKIIEVVKNDIHSAPGEISVTLANKAQSIASSISDLQNRALINELYAQGATNLLIQNFADNADPTHPAKILIWLPESMIRINKMILTIQFEPFRGYSKAVSSTTINLNTTEAGGATTRTTSGKVLDVQNMITDGDSGPGKAKHNHGIPDGTSLAIVNSENEVIGKVTWVPSGAHTHGEHDHTVTIPAHDHDIDMPSHGHDMRYGIYEGDSANIATITVDDVQIPTPENLDNINIIDYLSKDQSGKIFRNQWHEILITPNVQSRIIAAVFTQLFVNSRGGGDY